VRMRRGWPLERSLSFWALDFAVDGLPGISLWAFIVCGCIVFVSMLVCLYCKARKVDGFGCSGY